jgi:hypothetical protein
MHRWGKADPRRGSTADSLAELISPVILCEQTIILENLHHSFNALAHTSLPSPGLAPELFSWRMPAGLRLANCVMAITKKRFSLPNRAKRTAHS